MAVSLVNLQFLQKKKSKINQGRGTPAQFFFCKNCKFTKLIAKKNYIALLLRAPHAQFFFFDGLIVGLDDEGK